MASASAGNVAPQGAVMVIPSSSLSREFTASLSKEQLTPLSREQMVAFSREQLPSLAAPASMSREMFTVDSQLANATMSQESRTIDIPSVDLHETATASGEADPEPIEGEWTWALIIAIFAIVIGGSFQGAYQFAWTIASQEVIGDFILTTSYNDDIVKYNETKIWIWTSVNAAYALGGLFGSMSSASLADKYGRKMTVFYNNCWATLGAILMTIAHTSGLWYFILFSRFIFGFNAGITSVVVPVYLTELSPSNLRGTIGTMHQLAIAVALLLAGTNSLPLVFGTRDKWQQIYGFTFLPIVAQLILMRFCPESPYYLIIFENDEDEAESSLTSLRGSPDVRAEIKVIQAETSIDQDEPNAMLGTVFSQELRWATTLSVIVILMRQLSGVNEAIQSAADIIRSANLTLNEGMSALCGLNVLSVLITALSAWLVDCSCFGRRPLLLIGMFGMFFSSVAVVLSLILIENKISNVESRYTGIFFTIIFVISYSLGPSSIPWFYVTELYTTSVRANGMAFACVISWTVNFIITVAFPIARQRFSTYTFLIFVFPLFANGIITLVQIPETRSKSIKEIQTELEENRPNCCC